MVNIRKSQPAPDCLAAEKEKTRGEYKCGDVLERLNSDFLEKCYICEYKNSPSLNVEHFIPHKNINKELKFDWNNLFLSCSHCNNIKLAAFNSDESNQILDCTNQNHDVEKWIHYKIDPYPGAKVIINSRKEEKIVSNTVKLLNMVYNGTTTLKQIESKNIRKALLDQILKFQSLLYDYDEENDPEEKRLYLKSIKRQLHKSSAFAAFKRWIIRDNNYLKTAFGQYID